MAWDLGLLAPSVLRIFCAAKIQTSPKVFWRNINNPNTIKSKHHFKQLQKRNIRKNKNTKLCTAQIYTHNDNSIDLKNPQSDFSPLGPRTHAIARTLVPNKWEANQTGQVDIEGSWMSWWFCEVKLSCWVRQPSVSEVLHHYRAPSLCIPCYLVESISERTHNWFVCCFPTSRGGL